MERGTRCKMGHDGKAAWGVVDMKKVHEEKANGQVWKMGVLFFFTLSLTMLFLGMRGVMALGGFLSSGGPYLVTHPSPGWAWIMYPAILLTVATLGAGFAILKRERGGYLMVHAWSALCFSLGWNFLDFGLGLFGKPETDWSDVAVGLVILLLGAIPLLVMILDLRRKIRESRTSGHRPAPASWLSLQLIVVLAALVLGFVLFRSIR